MLADTNRTEPWVGLGEQRRDRPGMGDEQAPVRAGEAAQVLDPVVGGGLGLEAAEDAVQERVDELLLGGEVVLEGHRHRAESGRDGAHRQRAEALRGDGFGGVEDQLAAQRAARAPRAARTGGVWLGRAFAHVLDFR